MDAGRIGKSYQLVYQTFVLGGSDLSNREAVAGDNKLLLVYLGFDSP